MKDLARLHDREALDPKIDWNGNRVGMSPLEASLTNKDSFLVCVTLQEGLNKNLSAGLSGVASPRPEALQASLNGNLAAWKEYWNKSGMKLSDEFLDRIWYRNQYFLACCLREGKVCPGLFGNWTSGKIGTIAAFI